MLFPAFADKTGVKPGKQVGKAHKQKVKAQEQADPEPAAPKMTKVLKEGYKGYNVMFMVLFALGVVAALIGIRKGLEPDYLIGGALLCALGILGPVFIYMAFIALKVIMWTFGALFFGTIAYMLYSMHNKRLAETGHLEEVILRGNITKHKAWDEGGKELAERIQSLPLQKRIKNIKGK